MSQVGVSVEIQSRPASQRPRTRPPSRNEEGTFDLDDLFRQQAAGRAQQIDEDRIAQLRESGRRHVSRTLYERRAEDRQNARINHDCGRGLPRNDDNGRVPTQTNTGNALHQTSSLVAEESDDSVVSSMVRAPNSVLPLVSGRLSPGGTGSASDTGSSGGRHGRTQATRANPRNRPCQPTQAQATAARQRRRAHGRGGGGTKSPSGL